MPYLFRIYHVATGKEVGTTFGIAADSEDEAVSKAAFYVHGYSDAKEEEFSFKTIRVAKK